MINPLAPVAHGTTPADAQGAFAILGILSDDSKFKARLEELQKLANDAAQQLDTARVRDKDADDKLGAARASLDKVKALSDDANAKIADVESRERVLQAQQLAVSVKASKLDSEHTAKLAAIDRVSNDTKLALDARERGIQSSKAELDLQIAKHANDHATRETALKEREAVIARRDAESAARHAEAEALKSAMLDKIEKARRHFA